VGRLRGDYEAPLMRSVAEEVNDLFGVNRDSYLFRWSPANNNTIKDPLWDEPTSTARFVRYPIQVHYSEYDRTTESDDSGRDRSLDVSIYISLNHLIKAQVPKDAEGESVAPGDVVGFHWRGEYVEVDVIEAKRDGWVNDSDSFVGYRLDCKRRDKYVSERKTGDD